MISIKFVGSAAALALVAALNVPTASFAFHGGWGGGGGHWGGGGGGHWSGGAPAVRSFAAAPAARSFAAAPAARVGAPVGAAPAWAGGRTAWAGNNGAWHGGGFRDGFHHRRFFPGAFAAGVAVGALGSSYAYYGGPDYYYDTGYSDTYYDTGYYDDGGVVAVVPDVAGGGDPAYCAQRYRSYDPASGTFLGVDGLRHPCP
jgi:hypothetical protein